MKETAAAAAAPLAVIEPQCLIKSFCQSFLGRPKRGREGGN